MTKCGSPHGANAYDCSPRGDELLKLSEQKANDDIVGAAVYQYGDNIVVEFEGKYWLYEHYHNTDFDGNSD